MSSEPVHLLVMTHGMWGNPKHLESMDRIIRERRIEPSSETGPDGEQLEILIPETNKDDSTYDGVDWGGERVTEEVSGRFCAAAASFRCIEVQRCAVYNHTGILTAIYMT